MFSTYKHLNSVVSIVWGMPPGGLGIFWEKHIVKLS